MKIFHPLKKENLLRQIRGELKIQHRSCQETRRCVYRVSLKVILQATKIKSGKNRNRWLKLCIWKENYVCVHDEHDPIYLIVYFTVPCNTAVHNGKFHFFSLIFTVFFHFLLLVYLNSVKFCNWQQTQAVI